jgi:hypothetical protein
VSPPKVNFELIDTRVEEAGQLNNIYFIAWSFCEIPTSLMRWLALFAPVMTVFDGLIEKLQQLGYPVRDRLAQRIGKGSSKLSANGEASRVGC